MNKFFIIVIVFLIMGSVIKLFPYLLTYGLVIWAIVKIYGFFNRKFNKNNNRKDSTYTYKAEENKEDFTEDNTEDINEAIDVDYKDA